MSREQNQPPRFLTDEAIQLLLFGGKGGVGKTTTACSAAVSIANARPAAKVVLISTDPAHSTSDCLNGDDLPSNLQLVEVDAAAEQAEFITTHANELREIATRGTFFDDSDIDVFLELAVPGADELMAFLQIADLVNEGEVDTIVVDTAPTGHTLRLLSMPQLIDGWLGAMDALLAKHRYMASTFGVEEEDLVEVFLVDIKERVGVLANLLTNNSACMFVPVMIPERLSVAETNRLAEELEDLGIAADEAVLNRLVPPGEGEEGDRRRLSQRRVLTDLNDLVLSLDIWGLPLQQHEPVGTDALGTIWNTALTPGTITGWLDDEPTELPASPPTLISGKPLAVASSIELVLFAGKGGVGKTTMACSAAAHISQKKPVLLVSTDPAHSVGDCLQGDFDGTARALTENLMVMEVDAEQDFEEFREEFRDEIETAIGSLVEGASLAFDEEAMASLVDLAPPGLDELMALVRLVDEMKESEGSRTVIFDTAPTGHLVRLLETPELVEAWIAGVFKLMLKYESLVRLPKLKERLVGISTGLKAVRALMTDDKKCGLYAVSIPTKMACDELHDLSASCERLGISLNGVVVNRCMAKATGEVLQAMHKDEQFWIKKSQEAVRGAGIACVSWGDEPGGLEAISALGSQVFVSAKRGLLSSVA